MAFGWLKAAVAQEVVKHGHLSPFKVRVWRSSSPKREESTKQKSTAARTAGILWSTVHMEPVRAVAFAGLTPTCECQKLRRPASGNPIKKVLLCARLPHTCSKYSAVSTGATCYSVACRAKATLHATAGVTDRSEGVRVILPGLELIIHDEVARDPVFLRPRHPRDSLTPRQLSEWPEKAVAQTVPSPFPLSILWTSATATIHFCVELKGTRGTFSRSVGSWSPLTA